MNKNSKRFQVLAERPVNQDGFVAEWPEVGLIAMNSPLDPKPSLKIEGGRIAEMDGKRREDFDITKPSNFTRFCKLVRSTAEGQKGCYRSDQTVGQLGAECRNLSMHRCHCGFIDMAVPLILDGVYWGAVLCGQVLLAEPSEEQLRQVRKLGRRFGLDEEEMVGALKEIEVVSESKIRAAGELLQIVANYIVEMSVSQLYTKNTLRRPD